MSDSPRWCETCRAWGDHHTDRCPRACNCLSPDDVFRHAVYTKPECPVHPMPEGLADVLQPAISTQLVAQPILPVPIAGRARRC